MARKIERYYHTEDWASFVMLRSADTLTQLANEKPEQQRLAFLVAAILLSFAAIEARMNEAIHCKLIKKNSIDPMHEQFVKKHWRAISISIDEKMYLFTEFLTGKTFDTKGSLWKSFVKLRELRNLLMHYKLKKPDDKRMGDIFYRDLIHERVTVDRARSAVKVAKGMMNEINLYYFDEREDSYNSIRI